MIWFHLSQTLDTHKKLSFSHIMKHWKKQTPAQAAANKSKQILLRYDSNQMTQFVKMTRFLSSSSGTTRPAPGSPRAGEVSQAGEYC